ncbi:DUF3127 domain-containing protein [uncultured Prevotella sp.]|uniref:DUF3127 domain-containing protein n=1 Tax=uncultured Prevotella sp. TaxID=159272 RepID=UPI002587B806|nr:DUF3127 domain-containing protein [uncultured Prevotella sp.]
MELTGRIIVVQEAKSGTSSKTGNPWMMQEYVIEVPGQYPRHCAFTVFGEDRIKQLNIQMGEDLTVQFDIDAREYNAKWYNDFRAYNVIRGQQIPQPVQPVKDDLPFYPNNEPFPFQENGDNGGDLPF